MVFASFHFKGTIPYSNDTLGPKHIGKWHTDLFQFLLVFYVLSHLPLVTYYLSNYLFFSLLLLGLQLTAPTFPISSIELCFWYS